MAVQILIPTPLRPFTGGLDTLALEASTVGELLSALTSRHPELKRHLYADDGRLRSFVNIYVNDDDIRHLEREATTVTPADTVSIVPSVAGGSPAVQEGLPELTHEEIQRYSRHLIMPEVGLDGQRRPLRELLSDEPLHQRHVDVEFSGLELIGSEQAGGSSAF